MNYTRIIICIIIMAVVTYLPRVLPILIFKKKITNKYIKSFLSYVPYAVLAAMTFPEVFYSTANFASAVAGVLIALVLSYKNCGLLTVAIGGAGAVFVTEQILRLTGLL